jgi:hypothetical protein
MQVLKIVSRKQLNRDSAGSATVAAVTAHLTAPLNTRTAAEAANALLNLCYERDNVELAVRHGAAAALVPLLAGAAPQLQANAAGAVQSICFQKSGRAAMGGLDVVPQLVQLLASEHGKVGVRAIGALHNLSSDPKAIRLIRRCTQHLLNKGYILSHSPSLQNPTAHRVKSTNLSLALAINAQSHKNVGYCTLHCVGCPANNQQWSDFAVEPLLSHCPPLFTPQAAARSLYCSHIRCCASRPGTVMILPCWVSEIHEFFRAAVHSQACIASLTTTPAG